MCVRMNTRCKVIPQCLLERSKINKLKQPCLDSNDWQWKKLVTFEILLDTIKAIVVHSNLRRGT